MVKMGLYSEPINGEVKRYLGLYRESFIVDYMKKSNSLYNLIDSFLAMSVDGQDLDYSEKNKEKIIELCQHLKREKWEGDIICFTDGKRVEIPDFMMVGYDVCAESMHYSPLGDGFLMQYNRYPDFYADMSFEMFSMYRNDINENWLFNSFECAINFSKYCNHINKKHLHCIESENNWRPVAIYLYKSN